MKASQAEVLLRIAENTYADGDEIIAEISRTDRIGALHAHRLLEDRELLQRAVEINKQDCERFAQYMPRQDKREANRSIGNQNTARPALAPVKKVAE